MRTAMRSDAPSASDSGTSTVVLSATARIGSGHVDQLVQHPRGQRDRAPRPRPPTPATAAAPVRARFAAARHRATYPTSPTTASTAATISDRPERDVRPVVHAGTPRRPRWPRSPRRVHSRRGRERSAPSGRPSTRCRPTAGRSATRDRRAARRRSRARCRWRRCDRRARHRAAARAPTIAASAMISASGSRGRCTATNTAASAHAPTSTTLSTRPGPSGTRSPTSAAMTAERERDDREHDRRGGARRPRRALARIVADARELQGLDVVEAGGHGHSDRRTTAGRVRAARRAGYRGDEVDGRARPGSRAATTPSDGPGRLGRHAELVGDASPHERARRRDRAGCRQQPDRGHRASPATPRWPGPADA